MEPLLTVAALAIMPATVVGAVIGGMALFADPVNSRRLTLAVSIVAAPWFGVLVFGGPSETAFLLRIAVSRRLLMISPLVGAVLIVGWAWRSRASMPGATLAAWQHIRHTALILSGADLRFPHPAISLPTIAMTSGVLLLMFPPGRKLGRTAEVWWLLIEVFTAAGTFLAALLAILFALAFAVRRAGLLAAGYSALALAVVVGNVNLLVLGYWKQGARGADVLYSFWWAILLTSILALIPALNAQWRSLEIRRSPHDAHRS